MQLNINSDALVKFTNKLERIRKKSLPYAIRNTLNSIAFDVKTNTMLEQSEKDFTNRNKTFFKSKSKVQKAIGLDIDKMESVVGFYTDKKNQAVEDLEQQEHGGKIGGRSFIPLPTARVSNSNKKNVKKQYRLENINILHKIRDRKHFYSVIYKVGHGKFILYRNVLYVVAEISGHKIKLTPLYSYKRGRSVNINKKTKFFEKSSLKSMLKSKKIYKKEIEKQIKR